MLVALDPADGHILWKTPNENRLCAWGEAGCGATLETPLAAMQGAVFAGGMDGHIRAYAANDGHILWDFDTAHAWPSVNGFPAKGGAIGPGGQTIAKGMLFVEFRRAAGPAGQCVDRLRGGRAGNFIPSPANSVDDETVIGVRAMTKLNRRQVALAFCLAIGAAQGAMAAPLTVVELFQSQGCSSCPPANANLMALSDRPDLLTLSFGVTYWDYLGWTDSFAKPAFTARQWDYAHAFGRKQVFTPEIVVNGRDDTVGVDRAALDGLIARQGGMTGPTIAIDGGAAAIGPGKGHAQIWLVRYDPATIQVPVARGENEGRTLPHRNVVRDLILLGDWDGSAGRYAIPASPRDDWRAAILVQAGPGGAILAAASIARRRSPKRPSRGPARTRCRLVPARRRWRFRSFRPAALSGRRHYRR